MKNIMFKVISCLVGVVVLVLVIGLSLDKFTLVKNVEWLPIVVDIILKIALSLLLISTVFCAILNLKECIKKEGRQYIDKFILKTVCVFVLLYWIANPTTDYLGKIIFPALIWSIVPRAYDYITDK